MKYMNFINYIDYIICINSVNYWSYMYSLRGNNSRVLFNPHANNSKASIKGVNISGVSITQL